jgi:hypothetical protein
LRLTDEPHSRSFEGDLEETVCPEHCTACLLGETDAAIDQALKERGSLFEVGDPLPGHGLPNREQMAAAEARRVRRRAKA